mmetsp:Transcript_38025/g.72903  ORF Transcript_38025/g.72903 Transcript_38025/m.72903 type:complete len:378 (-) Transcript_38025:278-1411(-)
MDDELLAQKLPLAERNPRPEDPALTPPSVWMKSFFVGGQIFLGTLHVVVVHSSSHSKALAANQSTETVDDDTPKEAEQRSYAYSAVLLILLSEILKLAFSLGAFAWIATRSRESMQSAKDQLRVAYEGQFLRFGLPALVYAVENHIRFAVLKQLDSPVTWVVFSHSEIPIVALMTTFFLGRQLTSIQWVSVVLLVDGVMASQVSICESKIGVRCEHLRDFPLPALLMVLLSALMAATAGTACEFLFKANYSTSIHLQNAQLYMWGVVTNVAVLAVQEQRRMSQGTLWGGFDSEAFLILMTMATQGLCVAAVVKHMSNVAKVYASAVGLFVAAIMSALMSDFNISLPFTLAGVVVVCALFLYHQDKPNCDGRSHSAAA